MKNTFLILLVALFAFSCASKKKATEATTPEVNTASTYKDMTAKCQYNIEMGDRDIKANGTLRLKRGSVIQMSISAMGLFEVARIELMPESLLVIDRFNKRFLETTYNELSVAMRKNVCFDDIESIFWGERTTIGDKNIEFAMKSDPVTSLPVTYSISSMIKDQKVTLKMQLSNTKTNTGGNIVPTNIDRNSYKSISSQDVVSLLKAFM